MKPTQPDSRDADSQAPDTRAPDSRAPDSRAPDSRALAERWTQYAVDPGRFAADFWPQLKLAPYQRQILESVRDNTETWVHSANQMGKTLVAALASLWFFATRKAKVITSSTSEHQLSHILWGEIEHLVRTANVEGQPFSFRFEQTSLRLHLPPETGRTQPDKKYYLLGQVAAQVESFQGHHLPRLDGGLPTVLFVFEEASGLEREFYDAASSQAHRLLAIGNPLRPVGVFYEKCRAGDAAHPDGSKNLLRKVIHVSGEDSPNVQYARRHYQLGRTTKPREIVPGILSYDAYQERLANWSPDQVRTRLQGLFSDDAEERLFPLAWLEQAQELGRRWRAYLAEDPVKLRSGRPFALGVDVAQGGGDETVWVVLGRYGVVDVIARRTPNTAEIAGRTLRLMRRYRIPDYGVVFDSGGGGKQIADYLRDRRGYEEIGDVPFGAAAFEPAEYRNRRAELYGELRKALEPCGRLERLLAGSPSEWTRRQWCVSLPPDEGKLREELLVLPKRYDSAGRLYLPPKDRSKRRLGGALEPSIRELLGRSPDRADALALAYYAWRLLLKYREATRIRGPLIY